MFEPTIKNGIKASARTLNTAMVMDSSTLEIVNGVMQAGTEVAINVPIVIKTNGNVKFLRLVPGNYETLILP
jgi:hypothetical protein